MNTFGQSSEDSVEAFYAEVMLDNHIPILKFLCYVLILDGKNVDFFEYQIETRPFRTSLPKAAMENFID